jgi:hypothetical protein
MRDDESFRSLPIFFAGICRRNQQDRPDDVDYHNAYAAATFRHLLDFAESDSVRPRRNRHGAGQRWKHPNGVLP